MSPAQAAAILKVSPAMVRAWCAGGQIEASKEDGAWMLTDSAVARKAAQRADSARAEAHEPGAMVPEDVLTFARTTVNMASMRGCCYEMFRRWLLAHQDEEATEIGLKCPGCKEVVSLTQGVWRGQLP